MAAEADPNVQDRLGLSALMVASISGEAECVRVLMQGGAKTDLLEDHGYTALALAQQSVGNWWLYETPGNSFMRWCFWWALLMASGGRQVTTPTCGYQLEGPM